MTPWLLELFPVDPFSQPRGRAGINLEHSQDLMGHWDFNLFGEGFGSGVFPGGVKEWIPPAGCSLPTA